MQAPIPLALSYHSIFKEGTGLFNKHACYASLFYQDSPIPTFVTFGFASNYVTEKRHPQFSKAVLDYWQNFINYLGEKHNFCLKVPTKEQTTKITSEDDFFGTRGCSNVSFAYIARVDTREITSTAAFVLATLSRYITEFPWIPATMWAVHTEFPDLTIDQAYLFANAVHYKRMNNHSIFDPQFSFSDDVYKNWSLSSEILKLCETTKTQKSWKDNPRKHWIEKTLTPGGGNSRPYICSRIEYLTLAGYEFQIEKNYHQLVPDMLKATKPIRKYSRVIKRNTQVVAPKLGGMNAVNP